MSGMDMDDAMVEKKGENDNNRETCSTDKLGFYTGFIAKLASVGLIQSRIDVSRLEPSSFPIMFVGMSHYFEYIAPQFFFRWLMKSHSFLIA